MRADIDNLIRQEKLYCEAFFEVLAILVLDSAVDLVFRKDDVVAMKTNMDPERAHFLVLSHILSCL